MADKVQVKLYGVWQDLRSLRLDVKLLSQATPDVYFTTHIAYDIPASDDPDESDYVGFLVANNGTLPASKVFFDVKTASPTDHQKWSQGAWIKLVALGGAQKNGHANIDIKARVMATVVGDDNEHQYQSVNLDFSGMFVAMGTKETWLNTRTI
jgi:hypothetical protein